MNLQLSVLQREHLQWVRQNFPQEDLGDAIFGAVEEIGELAHHYLKRKQGIRGTHEYHSEEMGDAVADCVIFMATVCDHLGLDYGVLVQQTWEKVRERDWVKDPENAGQGS